MPIVDVHDAVHPEPSLVSKSAWIIHGVSPQRLADLWLPRFRELCTQTSIVPLVSPILNWWPAIRKLGTRNVSLILEMLHRRGEIAVVGRRGGQRVWGLAADWYPDC